MFVWHCGCIPTLHADVRVHHADTERVCQCGVLFQAFQVLHSIPQPICGQTRPRTDFQDRVSQLNPVERPGKNPAVRRPSPMP